MNRSTNSFIHLYSHLASFHTSTLDFLYHLCSPFDDYRSFGSLFLVYHCCNSRDTPYMFVRESASVSCTRRRKEREARRRHRTREKEVRKGTEKEREREREREREWRGEKKGARDTMRHARSVNGYTAHTINRVALRRVASHRAVVPSCRFVVSVGGVFIRLRQAALCRLPTGTLTVE